MKTKMHYKDGLTYYWMDKLGLAWTACGQFWRIMYADQYMTEDKSKVTCKSCMRTVQFKQEKKDA